MVFSCVRKKYKCFVICLVFFSGLSLFHANVYSQDHLQTYRISLLTYLPGNELYSIFGHSAIRVRSYDSTFDKVYNYGTFDFGTPNFYLKFIRGKLKYRLARTDFEYVLTQVFLENRTLLESELNITEAEKRKLIMALNYNYLPENREYFYDFFYDNCATRIYHLIDTISEDRIIPLNHKTNQKTYRQLICSYLPTLPWTHMGINILMGYNADKKASTKETSFLPLYLLNILTLSERGNNRPIFINHTEEIYRAIPIPPLNKIRPVYVFILLLILTIFIKIAERKRVRIFLIIDYLIFLPAILLGILIILLWTATDHYIYNWNYNLFWANPLFLLLLPGIFDKQTLIRIILMGMLIIAFIFQLLFIREIAILLLIIVLFIRVLPVKSRT